MSRRRYYNRADEQGRHSVSLDEHEKRRLCERVDTLLARIYPTLACPVSIERLAEVWNSFTSPIIMRAVRDLETMLVSTRMYTANHVTLNFLDAGWKIQFANSSDSSFSSPFYKFDGPGRSNPSWEEFQAALGADEPEFFEWAVTAHNGYADIVSARTALRGVLECVTTAGMLCRIVPEMLNFVGANVREAQANQKKRSPMPEGYYKLNLAEVEAMNNLIAKCQLLPANQGDDISNVQRMTYAHRITSKGAVVHERYSP